MVDTRRSFKDNDNVFSIINIIITLLYWNQKSSVLIKKMKELQRTSTSIFLDSGLDLGKCVS